MLKMEKPKRVTVNVPPDIHSQLRIVAAEQGTTMTDILLECIERVIEEHLDKKKKDKDL